ncbi:uncharacterized protein FA14DRAFT_162156 [Meira miltonrushii]|uniref:histidine kinase n=1 Tax=Meira miltonrushii TaxID=1280837 RepID=A0A316V5U8_9BASI|nr:uncharacterized protein FA14DRAFT_162156 [Meira miltonrushii]PWN32957.1 hypothetical protein FA14DRAFT_162156 [Meira miltonrushii]
MALDSCSSGSAIENGLQRINLNTKQFNPDHHEAKARNQGIENFPSQPKIVHNPAQPAENDSVGWQRFLAAYQSGKWESCDDEKEISSTDDSPSADLTIVYDSHGTPMDNKDYFHHYHHLAAPNLPPMKRRKRHEALLRHGIVKSHSRQHLQRYAEMAKRIFDCDMVTLSFASADERNIIFLAADGPPISQVPTCASICSHALLLEGDSDIFVVPDMAQDWRFDRLFGKEGFHKEMTYRFHASAPILLSCSETPCCKMSVSPIHAGRFSIFSSKPRPNFDKEDAKILLDFARMTQEAMENEFLNKFASRSRKLQRDSTRILSSLNTSLEQRLRSNATVRAVGLQMPGMGDLFPLMPDDKPISANPTSPVLGDGKPVYASILEDVEAMQGFLQAIRSSLSAKSACLIDGSNLSTSPLKEETHSTTSEIGSDDGKHLEIGRKEEAISMVAITGESALVPQMRDDRTFSSLESWFEMAKSDTSRKQPHLLQLGQISQVEPIRNAIINRTRNRRSGKCPYGVHGVTRDSKDELPCCCILSTEDAVKLIEPILPSAVATCLVIPIVAENAINLKKAPLAMMCLTWDQSVAVSAMELDFCSMLAIHLAGLACQEQASVISNGQLNLIRIMQHELRTPLNGIMGVSEGLRDGKDEAFFGKETKAKWSANLELEPGMMARRSIGDPTTPLSAGSKRSEGNEVIKAARVLAPQLESIHVSSMMLKTILDDILTLDNMFDGSSGARKQKPEMRNRDSFRLFEFAEVIESACREELRYSDLQAMRIFRAVNTGGSSATPSERTKTPTSGLRGTTLAATAGLMESAERQEANDLIDSEDPNTPTHSSVSPESHLQPELLSGNLTMITLPPSITVKIDEKLTNTPIGNREKLHKIVGRLVSNAIRFTPQSGLVDVEVRLSSSSHLTHHVEEVQKEGLAQNKNGETSTSICSLPGEGIKLLERISVDTYWIQLLVKDSGIGMRDDFLQDSYLKPFTKADGFTQGIGLGSTVAFALIKSMGGAYTIQSRIDKGTEVNVFLPFSKNGKTFTNPNPENELKVEKDHQKSIFTTAIFVGFESEPGTKHVSAILQNIMEKNGVQCIQEGSRPSGGIRRTNSRSPPQMKDRRLYVIHENALSASKAQLPSDLGQSNVYSIVITRNALRLKPEPESMMLVRSGPHVLLIPPFGPSTWDMLEQLLKVPMDTSISRNGAFELAQAPTNIDLSGTNRPIVDKAALPSAEEEQGDYFSQSTPVAETDQSRDSPVEEGVSPFSTLTTPRANAQSSPSGTVPEKNPDRKLPAIVKAIKTPFSFSVLAVEDNPINMRLLTTVLRKLKIPFTEAKDGVEAVEKFKSYKPSVVLLDISLPLMDGFDACIAMRKYDLPIRPKIIAITAMSTEEDKYRGLQICGMDEWQTKPVSLNMLKARIAELRQEHEDSTK